MRARAPKKGLRTRAACQETLIYLDGSPKLSITIIRRVYVYTHYKHLFYAIYLVNKSPWARNKYYYITLYKLYTLYLTRQIIVQTLWQVIVPSIYYQWLLAILLKWWYIFSRHPKVVLSCTRIGYIMCWRSPCGSCAIGWETLLYITDCVPCSAVEISTKYLFI